MTLPTVLSAFLVASMLFAPTSRASEREPLGVFRNTEYYLCDEAPFANAPKDTAILDKDGQVLAHVNSGYKRLLDIEGSGILLDGRVVTYFTRKPDGIRYTLSPIPGYGVTTHGCAALPFRTIAVDRETIPLGTVVHIRETEGMPLPDGTFHDGNWIATDTGSAIKGDRIDIFTGTKEGMKVLTRYGLRDLMPLHLSLVQAADPTDRCVFPVPGAGDFFQEAE